jgi:hypothetical protein
VLNSLIGGFAALVAGSTLAVGTIVGVVYTQTSEPEESPANAEQPFVDYGSTE